MTPDPRLHREAKLLTQWQDLAREAGEQNCFYAPAMLMPALRRLAQEGEVKLLEAWQEDRLIGLLPVTTTQHYGRYPLRCSTNWVHRHCFFGAPLVWRGQEEAAWEQFLSTLDRTASAPNFLHLTLLDAEGANVAALGALCKREKRGLREVHRYERAMLYSELTADGYWEANMRGKKRKEIRRLQKRLQEMGTVESRFLTHAAELPRWCEDFLMLERSGWKGEEGTALALQTADTAFFHESLNGAFEAGTLDFLRIDFDAKPMAMLINFRAGVGSFSFKIAFDETMARFSPGVLIELENLRQVLDREDGPHWMDSCAAPDHPMIDSLWAERRTIVQYRVALKGAGRALAWSTVEAADLILNWLRALTGKSKT